MVKPIDIYKRLCEEFPNGSFLLEHGADTIQCKFGSSLGKECILKIRKRIKELKEKAILFNAQWKVGHVGNKRNWWKRV